MDSAALEVDRFPPRPFLKWAGGKSWLVDTHKSLFPSSYEIYFEPFLGGASVFFALQPDRSVIGDANPKLVNAYRVVKDFPKEIERKLQEYQALHSQEFYYQERAKEHSCEINLAAQFIYLNRTCFNGLYRENLKGQFNVPIGTKTSVQLRHDDFDGASKALKNNVEIAHSDFETLINRASLGDFVYVDPPYLNEGTQSGFVKYTSQMFDWDDQERLTKTLIRAKDRGVKLLVSGLKNKRLMETYEDLGQLVPISRKIVIAGENKARGQYTEIVVRVNY
ncbi:Dam family site-specific DNA-(adenine-N6)-methyltransferase [Alphaproteobacteria bacterium]|nr:Dam family site-specific DNA-(adenine-N6)-methyltransferase [Alphaproteobacteria bacterium]